ncbi:hypothetical protein ES703_46276 [subsurface metagenome]
MDKHKPDETRKHREEHKQMVKEGSKGWNIFFIIILAIIIIWFLIGVLRIYGG